MARCGSLRLAGLATTRSNLTANRHLILKLKWDLIHKSFLKEVSVSMNVFVPISIGELLDKVTILEIKLERIYDEHKLENIRHEHILLQNIIDSKSINNDRIRKLTRDLKNVNEQLWMIEDLIREKESVGKFDKDFIKLARSVYVKNDRRAAIKRELNILTGSELIEEKSYKGY